MHNHIINHFIDKAFITHSILFNLLSQIASHNMNTIHTSRSIFQLFKVNHNSVLFNYPINMTRTLKDTWIQLEHTSLAPSTSLNLSEVIM